MRYVTKPPNTDPTAITKNTINAFSPASSSAVDVNTIGNGMREANTELRNSPSNPYFTKKGFSRIGFRKSINTYLVCPFFTY